MHVPTIFTTPIAVDTWDANFRWRQEDILRDRTIDATWARVAGSIAQAEQVGQGIWCERFIECFRSWQMLPDSRLLRWAGTDKSMRGHSFRAVLNLPAFVIYPQAAPPHFDDAAFSHAAALALRFVDDACLVYGHARAGPPHRCVGIIGLGQALACLQMPYGSEHAVGFSSRIAQMLARTCREASTRLAAEKGPRTAFYDRAGAFGHPSPVTCIRSHNLLATLANQTSDALDPLTGPFLDSRSGRVIPSGSRRVSTEQLLLQQLRIRSAVQPWIDAPIDYPLIYSAEVPEEETKALCRRAAQEYGLAEPRYRRSV